VRLLEELTVGPLVVRLVALPGIVLALAPNVQLYVVADLLTGSG